MKTLSKGATLALLGLLFAPNLTQATEEPPKSASTLATKLNDIPDDIFRDNILPYLKSEESARLKALHNKTNWQETVQESIRSSRSGVRLQDGTWMFFPEAVYKCRSSEIVHFNDAAYLINDVDYLINHLPSWREETIVAAQTGTEPKYLKAISALNKVKFDAFILAKEAALRESDATKAQWQRHAYSVLFSGRAAWHAAWHATWHAAGTVARRAAKLPTWNAAENAVEHLTLNDDERAAWDAVGYAARDAAWDAAKHAAWDAARDAAWDETWDAARDAAWDAAFGTASNASYEAATDASWAEITRLGLTELKGIGIQAYRTAEKVVLIYFLQHADNIFERSYSASLSELPENTAGIFDSKASWDAKKKRYLAAVLANPEQAHFIKAWTDNLDRIAGIIETLD